MSSLKKKIINCFSKTYIWFSLALIALILCIDIELRWLLVPCKSKEIASAVNRIILALSYSYIAATIFHLFVNYLPSKRRGILIKPFINSELWSLSESFRLCKIIVNDYEFHDKEYTKEEFCQKFSSTNFDEHDAFSKELSKFAILESLRSKIIGIVTVLLTYKEFISDECFDYLIDVMNSSFINNGLHPYKKESNNYYCNQDEVGACIFDLHKKSRLFLQ